MLGCQCLIISFDVLEKCPLTLLRIPFFLLYICAKLTCFLANLSLKV